MASEALVLLDGEAVGPPVGEALGEELSLSLWPLAHYEIRTMIIIVEWSSVDSFPTYQDNGGLSKMKTDDLEIAFAGTIDQAALQALECHRQSDCHHRFWPFFSCRALLSWRANFE